MNIQFDSFNRYEIPEFTLAKLNFRQISVIQPLSPAVSLRFNSLSDLTFRINLTDDTSHYFWEIKKKRLIKVEGLGWWMITKAPWINNGVYISKEVECKSYNVALTRPTNLAAGTYKFYDFIQPEGTLLYKLMAQYPRWSIGYVSTALTTKYRTFDMPNTSTLDFLYNDAEQAYECVFVFDTENFVVNAYTTQEAIKPTTIAMDYGTLIKEAEIADTDDSIVTCLAPYGANEFSIHSVNPLGTGNIYNFDYYKNEMTSDLRVALEAWEAAIEEATPTYSTKLTQKKSATSAMLVSKAELKAMETLLASGNQVITAATTAGYSMSSASVTATGNIKSWIESRTAAELKTTLLSATAYPAINYNEPPAAIAEYVASVDTADKGISEALCNVHACEIAIQNQNASIVSQGEAISVLENELAAINSQLKMETFFSADQLLELDVYIDQDSYTNEYIVKLDSMTPVEIQDLAEDLLADGRKVLETVSQPTYTFSMNLVNYLFLKEYQPYIQQTELGCTMLAEVREDDWISPLLLEVEFAWEEPERLNLTFGNRFRLQAQEYTFDDLWNDASRATSAFSNEFSGIIAPVRNGTITEFSQFINSSLDAAKNAVLAGTDQSMVLDENGFIGRKRDSTYANGFHPEQIKLVNNILAFTDDNFVTCKAALGKVLLPGGGYTYGLVAESVYGTLLAGENLRIINASGTFNLDEIGLSYTTQSANARILSNPTDGFHLQKKVDGVFVDKLAMDMNGNVTIAGELVSVANVGGWTNEDAAGLSKSGSNNFARLGGANYAFSAGLKSGETETRAFSVDYDGNLIATKGTIANWVIGTNAFYTGNISSPTLYLGTIGIEALIGNLNRSNLVFKAGNNFGVDNSGKMYASAGDIGGFTITTSGLSSPSLNITSSTIKWTEYEVSLYASNNSGFSAVNCSGALASSTFVGGLFTGTTLSVTGGVTGSSGSFSSSIDVSGPIYNTLPDSSGGEAVYWGSSTRRFVYHASSRKYKNTITSLSGEQIMGVKKLNPVTFYYNDDDPDMPKHLQYGLIAEEVADVYSEMIGYRDGVVNSMHYDQLWAPIIGFSQFLDKRISKIEQFLAIESNLKE